MKLGDYVRTRNGLIFKIVGGNVDNWELDILYDTLEFFEDTWLDLYKYNDNGGWFITEHCRTSPNIIDLIEVGDYVNGEKVCYLKGQVPESDINSTKDVLYTEYVDEYGEWYGYEEDEIESIVTKEQFESMEYKVK